MLYGCDDGGGVQVQPGKGHLEWSVDVSRRVFAVVLKGMPEEEDDILRIGVFARA